MANERGAGHTDVMPFISKWTLAAHSWLERVAHPSGTDVRKKTLSWVLVFTAYLLTAQIGVYLYRDIGTSPALIWPPVGIALAAVLLEGYWIGTAIAVGALMNGILSHSPPLIIIGSTLASTIQPLVGGYILRKLRFNSLLNSIRDVFLLSSVAFVATAIMPLINYFFVLTYNEFSFVDRVLPAWPQSWMGGALSALVLTPFLSRWVGRDISARTRIQQLEVVVSITFISFVSYLTFATPLSAFAGTTLLLVLIVLLFWVAFRIGPRVMSLALLIMTAISLAGAIYGIHSPSASGIQPSLSERLISTQIFDIIFCFFFFILVSVEEQRKDALKTLALDAERLESALETIRAEDRAKNEFIATLAHELRNPLAPVMSGLELLRIDEKDPERREILDSAQRQSFMMRHLLDELLDVARIARGTIVLDKRDVLFQDIVRHSMQGVEHFFKEREHSFSATVATDEIWVHGDSVRLTQILTNILYNAAKYTDIGGKVTLVLEKNGKSAIVRVKDNGIGIEQTMRDKIFEPFYQDSRRSEVGTGLGLGLSIAKRLVTMHDGTIHVESEGRNKGSTFIIELPTIAKPAKAAVKSSSTQQAPSTILVVDDNKDAAKGIAKLLRMRGHIVDIAYSGVTALQAIDKKPKFVILDIGLPDIDGLSVARQMHEKVPPTVIIALSGYGSSQDKKRAAEAGIAAHITKPASLTDIEEALAAK